MAEPMMRQAPFFLFTVLTLLLAGCYQQPGTGRKLSPDIEQLVLESAKLAHARNLDGLLRQLPQPAPDDARLELERMLMTIPTEPPQAVGIIAFEEQPAGTVVAVGYEFERMTTVLQMVVGDANGRKALLGIHEARVPTPLSEIGSITWRGKGWLHYAVLAVAIVNPILIVTALVVCVRTSSLRRKWLWIVGILAGVGQLTLNWHTGEFELSLLRAVLFGAGFSVPQTLPPVYYPLILHVALPVGAVWFLASRHGIAAPGAAAAPVAISDSGAPS